MKKAGYYIIPLLAIALIVWVFFVALHRGDFYLTNYSVIHENSIELNKSTFLGYGIEWNGNGKPVIKDIRFIKKDGSYFSNDDNEGISVALYIEEIPPGGNGDPTGSIIADETEKAALISNYLPIEGYVVSDKAFNLVVEVTFLDSNYKNNINAIEIDYDLLGTPKEKIFSFEGFVSEDN